MQTKYIAKWKRAALLHAASTRTQTELVKGLVAKYKSSEAVNYIQKNYTAIGFQRITRLTLLCTNILDIVAEAQKKIPTISKDTQFFIALLNPLETTFTEIKTICDKDNKGINSLQKHLINRKKKH